VSERGAGQAIRIPVIHAVTNDAILARPDFLERARAVMRALGTHGAIHLRGSRLPAARLHDLAAALAPARERTACWLVVNDRLDVALAAGASAVQLTSRSMSVADAQHVASLSAPARTSLVVGASVHTAAEAAAAAAAGASWVVAGHVFATPSHPGAPGRGIALIREIAVTTSIPCIAIGGIRPEHVETLRSAGAHGVAAISGIWGQNDAERAAIDYLSAYEHQRGP
jgi:thiamine-phosphate diphosphorylase